ncbi:MAG TPA: RNA methyltransferase [Thermoanaerobaculia bacterium]|nr:RNA methyltransferase [Thermoanaerobaculia bacterium]
MKLISSRQNAWFKRARAALREHRDEIIIEGPRSVADALAKGWNAVAILVTPERSGHYIGREIVFDPSLVDALAGTKTSQGVLGLFERPRASLSTILARRDTVAVALDGVQDPGNVGTIVRLAAAFDASGLILLPGCADPFSPKAIRASAGAILDVPVAAATPDDLLAADLPLFCADGRGERRAPPAAGAVLVLGSEGSGASRLIRERATPIAIETSGRVESLNVAAAAAILLERSFALRRR